MNISRNIFMMCYFLSKRLRVTLRVGQNRILKIDPDFLWTLIINHIPVLKGGHDRDIGKIKYMEL